MTTGVTQDSPFGASKSLKVSQHSPLSSLLLGKIHDSSPLESRAPVQKTDETTPAAGLQKRHHFPGALTAGWCSALDTLWSALQNS